MIPPRENPSLIGHAAAEATILLALANGRLPHAWLLLGPKGVGKATLAFRFAGRDHAASSGNLVVQAFRMALAMASID